MADLEFDRDNLEEVWRKQPRLLMEYGSKLAQADRDVAEAKLNLEAVEAKLYDTERKNLSMNGIKFNESVLTLRLKQTHSICLNGRSWMKHGTSQTYTNMLSPPFRIAET